MVKSGVTKMSFNKNNTDEYSTKVMMEYPITPLARMIGRCWFLGPKKLAEKADVPLYTVVKALRGEEIAARFERKIIAVLI